MPDYRPRQWEVRNLPPEIACPRESLVLADHRVTEHGVDVNCHGPHCLPSGVMQGYPRAAHQGESQTMVFSGPSLEASQKQFSSAIHLDSKPSSRFVESPYPNLVVPDLARSSRSRALRWLRRFAHHEVGLSYVVQLLDSTGLSHASRSCVGSMETAIVSCVPQRRRLLRGHCVFPAEVRTGAGDAKLFLHFSNEAWNQAGNPQSSVPCDAPVSSDRHHENCCPMCCPPTPRLLGRRSLDLLPVEKDHRWFGSRAIECLSVLLGAVHLKETSNSTR